MGIALFSASTLLESLHGVMRWFAPRAHHAPARHTPEAWQRPVYANLRGTHHQPSHATASSTSCAALPRQMARVRPLRVVRVLEAPQSSAFAGRMVISGRMADVCAELDRLAALETGAAASLALG